MTAKYLTTKIAETRRTDVPHYGLGRDGYSLRNGAPTSLLVRLEGDKRWRRVMVWCTGNCGTLFVRVAGECLITRDDDIPLVKENNV